MGTAKKVKKARVETTSTTARTKAHGGINAETEKLLAEFCRAAGHELGNALGTVAGELDYGLSSQDMLVRYRAMSVALAAAEKAIALGRNLRYFAMHPRLDRQNLDLSQLLLDTVELVEKDLKIQHVKVTVLVEASRYVFIDPGALQTVLLNLFTRAAQTMPQGGKLAVSMRQTGKHIEIACTDTGVGIPPERLMDLFAPVAINDHKINDTAAMEFAVSKALVESMGGEIRVQSQVGAGTTFILAFPYDPQAVSPSNHREGRRFRRVQATLPVEVSFQGQSPFTSELQTLSVRGCFLAVPEAHGLRLPEPESTGSLRIYYYQDQVLDISRCRVASHSKNGTAIGLGIEFLDFDARARKLLAAIVKSHSLE